MSNIPYMDFYADTFMNGTRVFRVSNVGSYVKR